jgi:hypothetical protein
LQTSEPLQDFALHAVVDVAGVHTWHESTGFTAPLAYPAPPIAQAGGLASTPASWLAELLEADAEELPPEEADAELLVLDPESGTVPSRPPSLDAPLLALVLALALVLVLVLDDEPALAASIPIEASYPGTPLEYPSMALHPAPSQSAHATSPRRPAITLIARTCTTRRRRPAPHTRCSSGTRCRTDRSSPSS